MKNECSVTIYSHLCCSKPIWPSFICGKQKECLSREPYKNF